MVKTGPITEKDTYMGWSAWQSNYDIPFIPEGRIVNELQSYQKKDFKGILYGIGCYCAVSETPEVIEVFV